MGVSKVLNLNRFRKQKDREAKEKRAEENRRRYGRKRSERERDEKERVLGERKLTGLRREFRREAEEGSEADAPETKEATPEIDASDGEPGESD